MRLRPSPHRHSAKLLLRRLASGVCGLLLRASSRPLGTVEGPTLVIAPHQDDETLGCGGMIARRRNDGLPVHVAFITDGAASHPAHPRVKPSEIAALRHREARTAMGWLGVERPAVHFLDEPDGTLNALSTARREALIGRLLALLQTVRPVEVFLPCNPDGSSEHDATFGFVIEAIQRSRLQPTLWQYPIWSWWNPGLMLRRWVRSRDCRRLPLEDALHGKLAAIDCYRTQLEPLAPDTQSALPPAFVEIFRGDQEFFFRHDAGSRQP